MSSTLPLVTAVLVLLGATKPQADEHTPAYNLSLSECLTRALDHNPLLGTAMQRVAQAEAERAAMAGKLYPTVSALLLTGPTPAAHGDALHTTTPVNDYGDMLASLGPFFRAELNLVQPLWTFGKINNANQALGEWVAVREAQLAGQRWEIITQVKQLYFALQLTEELLKVVDEIAGNLTDARGYLEEHLKSDEGDVKPIDRAKLTAYEAELKVQRIEIVTRQQVVRDGLTRLMGMTSQTPWRLAPQESRTVSLSVEAPDALVQTALTSLPEVEAVKRGLRALEFKRAAKRAQHYPDLFLAGRARYGVAPNRDTQHSPFAVDNFNFLDAGVALGLRYEWETGVLGAELDAADAELNALSETQRALVERVQHDVLAAHAEWLAAHDKLAATKEAYKATRAWSATAMEGFELGTVSAKDLIEGLSAFVKARFALLALSYEYNVASARLSQVTGRELQPELQLVLRK